MSLKSFDMPKTAEVGRKMAPEHIHDKMARAFLCIHPVSQARTHPKRDDAKKSRMAQKTRIDARMFLFEVAILLCSTFSGSFDQIPKSPPMGNSSQNKNH
jgi:hypothetical protein